MNERTWNYVRSREEHTWELFPIGGRWAWLCTCGEERSDYDNASDAELAALEHE